MAFSNSSIISDDLPLSSELRFKPLEPEYLMIRRAIVLTFGALFSLLFAIAWLWAPAWFPEANIPLKIVSSALLGITLLIGAYVWLADPYKGFSLREHDLSFQSGLVIRKCITQPITRVQHVEVKQGPIERRFNLASLLAYSAGGHQHTFVIPGLRFDEAKQLRAFILDHKEAVRNEQ